MSEMMNFVVLFEQQYYFLEIAASVTVLFFVDVVAGVGDGVDNGPDAVVVVFGCDFLMIEGVRAFGWISTSNGRLCFE